MSVSGVSASTYAYQMDTRSHFKQQRADFQALRTAIGSGDLAAAQKATSAFTQDIQSRQNSTQKSDIQPLSRNDNFMALQSALQSGDMAGAQKAFAALQQDIQNARQAHHHHPRQNDGDRDDMGKSTSVPTIAGTAGSGSSQKIGSIVNLTA